MIVQYCLLFDAVPHPWSGTISHQGRRRPRAYCSHAHCRSAAGERVHFLLWFGSVSATPLVPWREELRRTRATPRTLTARTARRDDDDGACIRWQQCGPSIIRVSGNSAEKNTSEGQTHQRMKNLSCRELDVKEQQSRNPTRKTGQNILDQRVHVLRSMFEDQFTSKVKKYSKGIRVVVTFAMPFRVVVVPVRKCAREGQRRTSRRGDHREWKGLHAGCYFSSIENIIFPPCATVSVIHELFPPHPRLIIIAVANRDGFGRKSRIAAESWSPIKGHRPASSSVKSFSRAGVHGSRVAFVGIN